MTRCAFLVGFLTLTGGVIAQDDKSKQPEKPTIPWVAKTDMALLIGKWQVAPHDDGPREFGVKKEVSALVQALFARDAVMEIKSDGMFAFVGTKHVGVAKNDMNKPEDVFKYGTYQNTTEPILVVTPKEGPPLTISYIVHSDRLTIRYPAHSCSRSGSILVFNRVEKDEIWAAYTYLKLGEKATPVKAEAFEKVRSGMTLEALVDALGRGTMGFGGSSTIFWMCEDGRELRVSPTTFQKKDVLATDGGRGSIGRMDMLRVNDGKTITIDIPKLEAK